MDNVHSDLDQIAEIVGLNELSVWEAALKRPHYSVVYQWRMNGTTIGFNMPLSMVFDQGDQPCLLLSSEPVRGRDIGNLPAARFCDIPWESRMMMRDITINSHGRHIRVTVHGEIIAMGQSRIEAENNDSLRLIDTMYELGSDIMNGDRWYIYLCRKIINARRFEEEINDALGRFMEVRSGQRQM